MEVPHAPLPLHAKYNQFQVSERKPDETSYITLKTIILKG